MPDIKTNPIQTQSNPVLSAVEWANFRKAKMNVNLYFIEDYRKKDDFIVRINKPNIQNGQNECNLKYNKGLWQFSDRDYKKTNPNKPNCRKGNIDAKYVFTKDYEEKCG